MRSRYFQEELDYLRDAGDEFSQYFPKLTKYLSTRSTDPDVERLLEGFAFLTAKLREKIDDQLPEVTETLLSLLWPNFLRPVAPMTIMKMEPVVGAISRRQVIEAGAEIESVPVRETVCRFKTSHDVNIDPLRIAETKHEISREASIVTLTFETLNNEPLNGIGLKDIRLYAGGSSYNAQIVNLWVQRYLSRLVLRNPVNADELVIRADHIQQGGLSNDQAVLPYPSNSFVGYRLLQEYFAFPEKYRFIDIGDFPASALIGEGTRFELSFEFSRPLPADVRISENSFELNTVPAINLFKHDAEPVLLTGKRDEYKIVPARRDGSTIEIYSIDSVEGWTRGADAENAGGSQIYKRFESFHHELERVENRTVVYFREKVRQSISGDRLDHFLSFVREDETASTQDGETISIELTCSNGDIASDLAIGDVAIPTNSLPSFVTPSNISRPTPTLYPLIDGTLQWQLISSLSLNYLSLQNVDALRTILFNFDFQAKVDRQHERAAINRLKGIRSIQTSSIDRLVKGLPIRGMQTSIRMKETHFANDGEMYLFSTILAEFFSLYATINSFHELIVLGEETGEEYRWTPRIGSQPLI